MYEREEWKEELLRYWMVERLIAAEEKGKKETRATCKAALEEVNKKRRQLPHCTRENDIPCLLSLHVNQK